MDVLKQIQYYKMSVVWDVSVDSDDDDDDDESNILDNSWDGPMPTSKVDNSNREETFQVSVFPNGTGGRWSNDFTTLAEAVAHCLKVNNLPIIE